MLLVGCAPFQNPRGTLRTSGLCSISLRIPESSTLQSVEDNLETLARRETGAPDGGAPPISTENSRCPLKEPRRRDSKSVGRIPLFCPRPREDVQAAFREPVTPHLESIILLCFYLSSTLSPLFLSLKITTKPLKYYQSLY